VTINPTLITIEPHIELATTGDDNPAIKDGWTITSSVVDLEGGDTTYAFLKSIIGGTISVVTTHEDVDVWHDDEFLYNGAEHNPLASLICGREMRGPVVLARSDAEGNTVGFTPEEVAQALDRLGEAALAMGAKPV
jgi:hypothetical protein